MSISPAKRKAVAERARHLCEYCFSQRKYSPDPFSVEHIRPSSKKGSDELENLALACQGCNGHKSDKTSALDPVSGRKTPLYNPRQDAWEKHFTWNPVFSEIIGLTAKGRATVELLRLNRPEIVNLRRLLRLYGEHPPDS
ncbi:MAG: HNH endonuclease [Acidobacteria bacterium]|nr:HNH endonuclease [Acidobacteriota bacterium]